MPKGRKPAIANIARPQGVLDDVIRPIIQKAAQVVANKAIVKSSKKSYNVYQKAVGVEDTMRIKRAAGFTKKSNTQYDKATDAYEKASRTAGSTKRANAFQKKSDINKAKAKGAKQGGGYYTEPRQARKQVEFDYKMAKSASQRMARRAGKKK